MNLRSRVILRILIPAVLFLLVTGLSAVAKEGDPLAQGGERHLNGHGFMPSIYVDDPFVSTSFGNFTGAGQAMNLETVFRDLDGDELFTIEGNLIFATLGMGFQQKLGSKWALGVFLSGQVKAGSDAASFMTEGADVLKQGELWAKYRLKRTEKCQLSLSLAWSYASTLYFTPYEYAVDVANGVPVEDASILISGKVWTSKIQADWARAFSPAWGLRVNAATGLYEVPNTSGVYKGSNRVGILGELDLNETKASFPLGITLGYTLAFPSDDPFIGQSGTLLGFWYTGKQDFVVGVETGFMNLPVANRDVDEVDTVFGIITLKYYF